MKHFGIAAIFAMVMASSAGGEPATLVIGIEDYARVPDVRQGDAVDGLSQYLDRRTSVSRPRSNPDTDLINRAITAYGDLAQKADRQLVVLSGRFVHSAVETFFLPSDARVEPLATVRLRALPLNTVLAYLAETPGESVLALATDNTTGEFGYYLDYGVGELTLPQGVTLIEGEPREVSRALDSLLANPGRRIADVVRRTDLRLSGFVYPSQVLRDREPQARPAPEPTQPRNDRLADLLAWRQADRANTPEAYESYIAANPRGQFVRMARNRLDALTDTPEARAERAEQSLDLDRNQRREIQRALTLLEFNTRGIDGIFGRGTRAAISGWQGDNGFEVTGFLNAAQINRLSQQAERRSAELEAAAEARREAQLARDRAFWSESGAFGDEEGYRDYLERFPDGEFAEVARTELDNIERAKRRTTDALDRQLWDEARVQNTAQAYRDYLDIAPDGAFRDEARTRIAALERTSLDNDAIRQARRDEQALNLSDATRRLIESRLDRFGLQPGRVDGKLDEDSRRAIRRYQQARELPETGYLSEAVVVSLLADSVRSLFR